MSFGTRTQWLLWICCFGSTACGGLTATSDSKVAGSLVKIFWPTADVSSDGDSVSEGMDAGKNGMVGSGKWDNRFFINFGGAELTSKDSFIIANAGLSELSIPAFSATDLGSAYNTGDNAQAKADIVKGLKQAFAGIDIDWFTSKPEAPFSTVFIGGTNFTNTDNVLGIAPLDLSNFSGQDKIFVFSASFVNYSGSNGLETLINVAAHEIAHSIGARHILSDDATLNPIVRTSTDDFDVSAKVDGADGEVENTHDVLLRTVGAGATANDVSELPKLVDLAMSTDGDVGQLSVFSSANAKANPNLNLGKFDYLWTFDGKQAEGTGVRVLFEGPIGSKFEIGLEVKNDEGKSASYKFEINKKNN